MSRRALLDRGGARGRIAVALVALALLLRLVPAGYMIMPAAHGGLPTLTLCSGQGPIAMPVPMTMAGMAHGAHQDRHDPDDQAGDHRCPFAAAAAAIDLAAPPSPPAFVAPAAAIAILLPTAAMPGLGLAAPPPPKTGPPPLD